MNKILVVDDVESNRKLLRQMLVALNNYEVIEAVDGKEAIEIYKTESPDLILMDINMPEMNGYQSATIIKSLTGDNYTPIIFITALDAKATLSNALFSGGDDFIGKPFDIDVLESKIKAHLRIRELNKQLNDKNIQLNHEQNLIEHFFESALKHSFLDDKIVKYHMSSMSTFNGDLFLVERAPQGGMYLLMGDFTGHGLTAAMGTLPVAMIFFKMTGKGMGIGDIARELNNQLNNLMPTGMFFAASLLEINSRGDIMSVWMGGMPESYWIGNNGELKGVIQSQHMPLGILNDDEFNDAVNIYNVELNDSLYLYSDGITEALSPDGEMFGNDRLKDILVNNEEQRFEEVLNELQLFTGAHDQNDDITLVEIKCSDVPATVDNKESVPEDKKLSWNMSVSLSEKNMREQDSVSELSEMLGSMPVLQRHKGILHVLLTEMYCNAVDHSILGLESSNKSNEDKFEKYYSEREKRLSKLVDASIVINFDLQSEGGHTSLKIKLTDNGNGYSENLVDTSNNKLHGHGLQIINNLCESFSFSDDGKSCEVLYNL